MHAFLLSCASAYVFNLRSSFLVVADGPKLPTAAHQQRSALVPCVLYSLEWLLEPCCMHSSEEGSTFIVDPVTEAQQTRVVIS
jgi:hypothetical protein